MTRAGAGPSPASSTYAFDAPLLLVATVLVVNLPLALPFEGPPRPDYTAQMEALEDSIAAAEARRGRMRARREHEEAERRERGRLALERSALEEESSRLERELGRRLAEIERLEEELAAARTPVAAAVVGAPAIVTTDSEPVFVSLTENRILELNEENYRFELARSAGEDRVVVATRTGDGDAIADLRRSSSSITRLLDGIDAAEQHLALLVWSDSFEAFRAVRDAARTRGIGVGWEPMLQDADRLLFGASGGRSIEVQASAAPPGGTGR